MFRPLREGAIGAMSEFACFDRWATLAWTDIKLRYRRTHLGPFWMTLNTAYLRPNSRGEVRLASGNPADEPLIDPRYLSEIGRASCRERV